MGGGFVDQGQSELKWAEATLSFWELFLNIWDGFTSSGDFLKHIES